MEDCIYVDVLFLRIFFMNPLCLRSVSLLLGKKISWKKLIFGSAAGTLWNLMLLLTGMYIWGMSFLAGWVMCRMSFDGWKDRETKWTPCYLFFIAFCMEGSISWTGSLNGAFLVPVFSRMVGKWRQKKETEVKAVLSFRGRTKELPGFFDSGNLLAEPLTGKMVHLVCYDSIKELLPECYRQTVEHYFETERLDSTKVTELQMYEFTFLSYHSIGKENGQLLGIRMDSAEFISRAGKKTEEKVLIGLTKQRLFVRGQDRMIVNGRLEI